MAKILAVEDSQTVASAIEMLLRFKGHKVFIARDGLAALTAMRAFVPELILLDILLPHTNGFVLCAMLRRNAASPSLPIIMVSSLNDSDTIERAYTVGADGYLSKPFADEALLNIISLHLGKNRHPNHVN